MGAGEEFEKDALRAVPADRYTRREALRWGSGAAAVAALTPALLASGCTPAAAQPASEVDVAIIGGGPSGLYAAYRLLTGTPTSGSPVTKGSWADGRPSVAMFEAADCLGGRIWSVIPPGAPHLIAEFRGMRFLKTQEIVPRLVRALRLPYVPFSHGDGRNLVYLRGSRFRAEQYADPAAVPYSLRASEAGKTSAELMNSAIDAYVPHAATGHSARRASTSIHLQHPVVRLMPAAGGGLSLTVQGPGGARSRVTAKHVIMAIPADPLGRLADQSPFLQDATLTASLATVGTSPASKMFLAFDKPWWSALGITGGSSITDLPIKRCWYFGTEGQQPGANPDNHHSLLMCYNDLSEAGYWNGYQPAGAFNGPPAPRTSPRALVDSAVGQLSELLQSTFRYRPPPWLPEGAGIST